MSLPVISIIVPMYCTERYLSSCVDSLRSQTIKDIEIILVDDGSPDRCGELADEFANEDSRVRVIHKSNAGVGPARNSGIRAAAGDYVAFVDSDDWVDVDMFESLYEVAERTGAQIVYSGFRAVSHGAVYEVREHPYSNRVLTGQREIFEVRRSFFGAAPGKDLDDPTPVSVWGALYRRALVIDANLSFHDVSTGEDRLFNIEACRAADSIACAPGSHYCYRKDDQPSLTTHFNEYKLRSFLSAFKLLETAADDEPDAFRPECHLRVKRCIIDYCRSLVCIIEGSSLDAKSQLTNVKLLLSHPSTVASCRRYPFWKLPTKQAVFYLALRLRSAIGALLLTKLRKAEK